MSRIKTCMQALQQSNRKAVVPYIVAGDPMVAATVPTMHAMVAAGADIIELGVPFSDPMAEGPVIQLAHERALVHNVSLKQVLVLVKEFRQQDSETPVVLMGYANPIEVLGYEEFAFLASDAGIDAVLTVDMPPEEAMPLQQQLAKFGIDIIFLIAPTTTAKRIEKIAQLASGYLYYVSLKGVTGAGHLDIQSVNQKMQEIKGLSNLPVCVGFGIKDGQSARHISQTAEGVVVGSVLVDCMAQLAKQGEQNPEVYAHSVAAIVSEIRTAVDA